MAGPNRGNVRDKAEDTYSTATHEARETANAAGQAAGDVKNKLQEGAQNVLHKAGEAASSVAHKAGEAASNVAHKAGELASTVGSKVANTASNVASAVGDKAEGAVSAVGQGMSSLAGTLREKAPHGGILGSAASTVAGGLESGGEYLREQGLSGMFDDMTALVRRHPMQALLVGFGVGFLLARATSRG
jgi:phage-related minor tail protein